jgi:hypothetical protein
MPTKKTEEVKAPAGPQVDLEHAKAVVNTVFSNFTTQELGNKISQFNMQGLANILVGMIANPDSLKVPEQPEEKK